MKKAPISIALCVIILAGIAYAFVDRATNDDQPAPVSDYKNATYMIDGQLVTLVDGLSESVSTTGSTSKTTTRYFGNQLSKDLNGDGRADAVFLLTQETGGSGTFFYVVAALNTEDGYVGSQALLLGDRIAPQTTESGPGKQVIVNYADRGPQEPMTTRPSFGKSLRLILDPESLQFGEVVADFEGEADPDRMTLGMNVWVWQRALYNDGKEIVPVRTGAFTLTFAEDGSLSVTTDCNRAGGKYMVKGPTITFTDMYSTLMYCEGSQEATFLKLLQDTQSFHFTSRGELIFELKYDSGTVVFR